MSVNLFLVFCLTVFRLANAGYANHGYSSSGIGTSYVSGNSYVPISSIASGNAYEYDHPGDYSSVGSDHNIHVPVIKDGVPVDTPEVQRARAEHFQLYAKAAAEAAAKPDDGSYNRHSQEYYEPKQIQTYYNPVSSNNYVYQSAGVQSPHAYSQSAPIDTPEVQQAKAEHYQVYAKAAARDALSKHYRYRRSLEYYPFSHNLYNSQPQHVPVITDKGVPVETPEVQAAKAQHLLAHAQARSGHAEWQQGVEDYGSNDIWTGYGSPQVNKVEYTVTHDNAPWQKYHGPQHIPILDKNGVPIDTPEVQVAKQQHLLAHYQAKTGIVSQHGSSYASGLSHGGGLITPNGVPEETIEVKIAKAQHLAAHAQEQAKHSQWVGQADGYGSAYSYYH